ncbi:MAG: hypothetical protein NXI00_00470 [Cytophagales bacterium]|nr:hypothetical protein [Cytophagales bacterium]
MILLFLFLLGIIGSLVYVIHYFEKTLPDRSFNYYEMKEFHGQYSKNKWWKGFLFFK